MANDVNRWLAACGGLLLLIGGAICSLLAWICLSINSLSISVAELRREIELTHPADVLKEINQLEGRVSILERK
jgi:hypothetical protein